jgi:hypothetical protein
MSGIFHDHCHAPSELKTVYSILPPVAPGVIHIGLFQSRDLPFIDPAKSCNPGR